MRAGADIDESIRFFDQCRQNVGCQHINGEDAGNFGFHFHPSFAITDAGIVDDGIKVAELVDLIGNGPRPGDCRQVPGHGSTSTGCRLQRVATSIIIAPVHNDLMALLDQEPGRQQTEPVR